MASSITNSAPVLKCPQPCKPSARVGALPAAAPRSRTSGCPLALRRSARSIVRYSAVPGPESSHSDLAAEAAELAELQKLQEENEKLLAAVAAKQQEQEAVAVAEEPVVEEPVAEEPKPSSTRMKVPPDPPGPEGWLPRGDGTDVVQYDSHLEHFDGHLRHRWGI